MDASDASAAPLATLTQRQAEAALLCRQLWERCGQGPHSRVPKPGLAEQLESARNPGLGTRE